MGHSLLKRTLRATRSPGAWIVPVIALLLLAASTPAWANVYASGLAKTGDVSFSYVLNENADTNVRIEVWKVGAMVYFEDLGPQTKGTHSWAWIGTGAQPGQTYKVKVIASDPGYSAWTKISVDATSTSFELPSGVSVYKDQNSAKFGTMYVSVGRNGTSGFGRAVLDGIYKLKADCSDDGFTTGGITWPTDSSPWKSCIGPDGHLYVSDWGNDLAFEFNDDLTVATQLVDATNKTSAQFVNSILVSGTGADRKLFLVNGNYNDTTRKGLIMYDLGTNTRVPVGNTGTQYIARSYFTHYPWDVARDSAGDWYIQQYNGNPSRSAPMTKFKDQLPLPLDIGDVLWEVPSVNYAAYDIDICEPKGWAVYGNYYTGVVFIYSMADGSYIGEFDAGSRLRAIAFDAAGNLVTVDNIDEWLCVWSPGDGANSFTTESYFTFDVAGTPQTVTVNATPPAGGTATGGGTFFPEQSVTVTASENVGYKLQKWTDGSGTQMSTSEVYTFPMPYNDLTLNAVFVTSTQRRLTLASVPSEAAQTLTGGGMYEPGTGVPIATTPKPLWTFSKWTTDLAGTTAATTVPAQPNASCTYTTPAGATTLYAQYVVASYNVTLTAVPTAGGAPSVDGGASHQYNTSVTVQAKPNANYYFMNWKDNTGAIKSRKPVYTFTMPGATVALTANYVKAFIAEGFEGLNIGSVDMNDGPGKPNLADNGDLNSGQPWWGTNPSNASVGVVSTMPAPAHSGPNALWGPSGNGRDYINLAYRCNAGSPYAENLYADWWFYDRSGQTWLLGGATANYCDDPFSLVYNQQIPANLDWPTGYEPGSGQNFTDAQFDQKVSLGMCDWWTSNKVGPGPYPEYPPVGDVPGFEHGKYQARIQSGSVPGKTSFGNGWFNVDLARSIGWHHGRITVGVTDMMGQTEVNFYIDDMSTSLLTGVADAVGFNAIELMTRWKNGPSASADTALLNWPRATMYDDIVIGPMPQPTPAAPVAGAATGVMVNSITWNWTEGVTVDGFHVFGPPPSAPTHNLGATTLTLVEGSLTSNKVYSRWVSSYFAAAGPNAPDVTFDSARTALAATCTLAVIPTAGTNVYTNAIVGNTYSSTSWPGFTNPGFGDDGGKVSKFKYKWSTNPADPITEGQGADWSSVEPMTPPPSDGTWYLYLRSYNSVGVGNGSTRFGEYIFDNQPPTGGSIVINNGDATTSSPNVTLTLSAVGATQMTLKNESDAGYGAPVAYATTKPWALSPNAGDKTVSVKFLDAAGNESIAYSDTITFEDATPVDKISDLWPLTNGPSYKLTDKVVTGIVGNAFWIEETDRSAAIKVNYTGAMPAQDRKVDVSGVLDSSSGQRVLNASSWTYSSDITPAPIKPLGVIEKSAGGAGINPSTPSISNGTGLYNIAMLVRIAGSAGNSNTADPLNKYFYLDDGSGLVDGAIAGIKVLCGSIAPATSGNKTVTGLVGVVGGKPVLIIRGSGDIL